ncbi:MAG: hypothetical protein ACI8RD_009564, partial [Bacillariaceae sp.]
VVDVIHLVLTAGLYLARSYLGRDETIWGYYFGSRD